MKEKLSTMYGIEAPTNKDFEIVNTEMEVNEDINKVFDCLKEPSIFKYISKHDIDKKRENQLNVLNSFKGTINGYTNGIRFSLDTITADTVRDWIITKTETGEHIPINGDVPVDEFLEIVKVMNKNTAVEPFVIMYMKNDGFVLKPENAFITKLMRLNNILFIAFK